MVHHVPVRADARRNRERILAAARVLVAAQGRDVTMEAIAQRAEVAVGTLYRHFPAKEDLVDAVVEDSVEHIATATEAALDSVTGGAAPGPAVADLFRVVARRHATDRALKAAAGRLEHGPDHTLAELVTADPGSPAGRAITGITRLLDTARAAGQVRADLTLADLMLLIGSVPGAEVPAAARDRFVEIVVAGLGPTTGYPPQPAPAGPGTAGPGAGGSGAGGSGTGTPAAAR
jgi:AcrR family transcriptional regulator